jgi:hypothetical protein
MPLLTNKKTRQHVDDRTDAEKLRAAEEKNYELREENSTLRAQLAGDPDAKWRWMWKATRQRDALDILNRRVVSQRFVLRTLEKLGRGLTKEEYLEARAAIGNEQLRNRIDDPT